MVEAAKNRGSANWWWLQSQDKCVPNRSPWLQSTLAELDEKTKTMLALIEEDADSFAQRAERYYKKRPELITMVEDFYRSHRSLAERFDQIKSESGTRLPTSPWSSSPFPTSPWSSSPSPLSLTKYCLEKSLSLKDKAYDSYSEAYGPDEESDESEVDDPEEEEMVEESETEEVSSGSSIFEELMKVKEELEMLREENKIQKDQLKEKDDEKREVIRQLSMAIDLLREENMKLRKSVPRTNTKNESSTSEFNKPKGNFFGKLFNGFAKSQSNHLIAL